MDKSKRTKVLRQIDFLLDDALDALDEARDLASSVGDTDLFDKINFADRKVQETQVFIQEQ